MNRTKNQYGYLTRQIPFALSILCSSALYAQTNPQPFVLEGTIGTAPVVMEFAIDSSNVVTGRYFYRNHSIDIALDGIQLKSGDIQLGENQDHDSHSKFDMILHPNHQGWQGEWIGLDSKKITIQLTPVTTVPKPSYQLAADVGAYDQIRLSGLSLQKKEQTHFGQYSLQWWKEPLSKINFFRITEGYPAETLTRINSALTARHWQEVNSYFECKLGGARSSGGEYDQTVTPRLMNDKVFSTSVTTSYYCGGAHPDFGDSPMNLNVATGKELRLEDVIWLGNETTTLKRNERGERVDYDYESKTLAPWLSKTMAKLYPQNVGSDKKDDNCDYRDPGVWSFPAFYFTPNGLHLAAYFARVARACDNPDWAILPWTIVNQHQGKLRLDLP